MVQVCSERKRLTLVFVAAVVLSCVLPKNMDIERLDEDNKQEETDTRREKKWNFGTYMIKIRSLQDGL